MAGNNLHSTATNLAGPDISVDSSRTNPTKYFNNLYSDVFSVSAGANDAIVAFFEQYTQNKITGQNLASAVLYTAQAQNINPMTILSDFQKMPKGQLNNYLAAFLNATRVPTSAIGIKTSAKTSPFVTRTILF